MNIAFEHEFQKKYMLQTFSEPTTIKTSQDVMTWRQLWLEALTKWHSPYKAVIDCNHLKVDDNQEVREALKRMVQFLEGFFLRKVCGYAHNVENFNSILPFEIFSDQEAAFQAIGIRERASREATDLRSQIQFENHFRQHTIEASFVNAVHLQKKADVLVFKSKLTNNLMQWHSSWNLLIDCQNFTIAPDVTEEWESAMKFFQGFFMKTVIGYSPRKEMSYPFKTFRSRHKAAAMLENEGSFSGEDADCLSRKQPLPEH